jgi:hypothetical protein
LHFRTAGIHIQVTAVGIRLFIRGLVAPWSVELAKDPKWVIDVNLFDKMIQLRGHLIDWEQHSLNRQMTHSHMSPMAAAHASGCASIPYGFHGDYGMKK